MKNSTKLWLIAVFALFSFSQATAQLRCFTLQAPEKIVPGMKNIAVMNFEDRTGGGSQDEPTSLSINLNDKMLMHLLDEDRGVRNMGKSLSGNTTRNYLTRVKTNVYTIVERSQLDQILSEQSLTASGAVSEADAAAIGKLLGLDVIMVGNFDYNVSSKESTSKSTDKEGNVYYTYYVTKTGTTNANMKIISVETGEIFAFTKQVGKGVNKANSRKSMYDARKKVGTDEQVIEKAFESVAWNLVSFFTPYFVATDYDFKKPKVKDYKEAASDAKKAIKKGDLDLAYGIIKPIYDQDNYEAALAHDVGILNEAVGNYEEAIKYYEIADELEGKKKSEKVLARAESGLAAMNSLKAIGVDIPKHNFDLSVAEEETAERVTTDGKKSDRISALAEPKKGAAVAAKVPGSTDFKVLGREGDYVKVQLLGGKEGYIHNKDIK